MTEPELGHWSIVVDGPPKAKERPRVTKNGNTYTPKRTQKYESAVKQAWKDKYTQPATKHPVEVEINFSKEDAVIHVREVDVEPSGLRGDIDNYIKSVLDALQGVAFENDKQVIYLKVWK